MKSFIERWPGESKKEKKYGLFLTFIIFFLSIDLSNAPIRLYAQLLFEIKLSYAYRMRYIIWSNCMARRKSREKRQIIYVIFMSLLRNYICKRCVQWAIIQMYNVINTRGYANRVFFSKYILERMFIYFEVFF